ncbi:MAG: NUDIX domain-containing protein [Patescibacteria group bacterium]|nr:NUDIX domain-containing protein [Patescibacteria group bacterium]
MNDQKIRHRVVGIIIKNEKILLLRRFRNNEEYYVFPGGGVEEGETFEGALKREMWEEMSIKIDGAQLLFEFDQSQEYYGTPLTEKNHYYRIENFEGIPTLGGPEKERMNEQNQYHIEWISFAKIGKMENLFPKIAVGKLCEEMKFK